VNRWPRWAIYTGAVWAGVLVISLVVAEWREPDLGQIESDLRELKAAQPVVVSNASIVPTPSGSIIPTPYGSLTPTEAEYRGAHYTVGEVRPGRVEFILEGPHPGALGHNFSVTDEEGFVCSAGINASPGYPLSAGQKELFWIQYTCREGARPKELRVDDLVFEFDLP
jgi:hypothetical protein